MPWTIPVYDRVLADVTNRTSKGFFNVVDWIRIHGNTQYVGALFSVLEGISVSVTALTTPTDASIPTVTEINDFVGNIESMRLALALVNPIPLTVLTDNYVDGQNAITPDYEDVNDWEENLQLLKDFLLYSAGYRISCGVAEVGQIRFWQNRFREPWVVESTAPVRRLRSGVGISGTGFQRQNGYRRYD